MNKLGRTRKRTSNLRDELILGECTRSGDKRWCIIAPTERYSVYRYFQQGNIDAYHQRRRKPVVSEIEHIIQRCKNTPKNRYNDKEYRVN